MGNQAGSLKKHLETAEKTGALNFTDQGLEKFPSDMSKVDILINLLRLMYSLQVEKNLRNLDLSRNKINSLPSSIGNFKVMKTLSLSKNKISSLPEDMGKMTKLENLNMSFNLLHSIPSSFQQLKHLRSLFKLHHCAMVWLKRRSIEGSDGMMTNWTTAACAGLLTYCWLTADGLLNDSWMTVDWLLKDLS